jgi:hypothetical protein
MGKQQQAEPGSVIRNAVIEVFVECAEAQVRALRRLRGAPPGPQKTRRKREGMSQVDRVFDILHSAPQGLHVSAIIARVEQAQGVRLDRESLVSALSKKVARNDRFVRVGKNTFALRKEDR